VTPPVLLIAVGNELRGDDAAGWRVADAVAAWNRPSVRVVRTHQLVPELAANIADAATVILIDAALDAPDSRSLAPVQTQSAALSHAASFAEVLALAGTLGGGPSSAWVLGIPAESFLFGADPSPRCERGIAAAVRLLASVLPNTTPRSE
jgi:hydrogenase maturation protease